MSGLEAVVNDVAYRDTVELVSAAAALECSLRLVAYGPGGLVASLPLNPIFMLASTEPL